MKSENDWIRVSYTPRRFWFLSAAPTPLNLLNPLNLFHPPCGLPLRSKVARVKRWENKGMKWRESRAVLGRIWTCSLKIPVESNASPESVARTWKDIGQPSVRSMSFSCNAQRSFSCCISSDAIRPRPISHSLAHAKKTAEFPQRSVFHADLCIFFFLCELPHQASCC